MRATFRVGSIHYGDAKTIVTLAMGNVGTGSTGMGVSANLEFSGIEAIDARIPRPGTLVTLTIERADTDGERAVIGASGGDNG